MTHSKGVYNLAQRRLTNHGTVVAKAMKLRRDVAIIVFNRTVTIGKITSG